MTIKITINGIPLEVKEGTTVLKAAKAAGIYIPTLCSHPSLESIGSCRMCVVEIEGTRNLPCSCTTIAEDGMVITTESPRITAFRKARLAEFIEPHPRDCLTCNENMRCELQKVVAHVGAEDIPYKPRENQLKETGLFFSRDYNKCIRCGRCVRACQEVRKNKVIFMKQADEGLEVGTALDMSLQDAGCEFCGACVDVCPTGALMANSQKGLADKTVTTTCPYCGVGCQLIAEVKDGKIMQTYPDPKAAVNQGQACVKGHFGIADAVYNPNRLLKPLAKVDGQLVEKDWETIYTEIAEKLSKFKPEEVAFVASARCTNEDNYVLQKFARSVIGTPHIDHCVRVCHGPSVDGLYLTLGSGAMTNPISDVFKSKCIMLFGSNPFHAHPVVGMKIKQAVKNGAKLIIVNPMKIKNVDLADLWIRPRAGTNIALVMGMIKYIIDEGLADWDFINERCENIEAFKESLKAFELDEVSRISGVPVEDIKAVARMYATSDPAAIYYGMGVTQQSYGVEGVWALSNLVMVTGNFGKAGAGLNPLRGQNNVQGSCDVGALPHFLPGYKKVDNEEARARLLKEYGKLPPPIEGYKLTEMPDRIKEGKIKALFVMGEDPAMTDPNAGHIREAYEKLDLLVVQDIYKCKTAEYADYVLAGASFAEKDGTFSNTERRVQKVRQIIEPLGESKPDWKIVCELAQHMGATTFNYDSAWDITREMQRMVPGYEGISPEAIDKQGIPWPCKEGDTVGTPMLHIGKFSRGKGLLKALEYKAPNEVPDDEYPFYLMTDRSLFHYNNDTMTGNVKGIRLVESEERCDICPEDAEKLGIKDGQLIKVTSRRGSVKVKARISDKCYSGMIHMTYHFSDVPVNLLLGAGTDPISGTPDYKTCAVKIELEGETANV